MNEFFQQTAGLVWNYPVILLCLLSGLFFSFRFGFIQLKCFSHAIELIRGKYDDPNEKGHITHFQALSAALSGTIGLGNIAGVAIAIALGGPGTVLWMWILGFFGMATKFVECTLGTHYREEDKETGEVRGGPMYYITNGLGQSWRPMAIFFSVAIAIAGIGSASLFQANQAAQALFQYYSVPPVLTGIGLFIFGALVVIGGINRIGKVASKIVPFMCGIYVLGSLVICLLNIQLWPSALKIIISDAFTGQAAAGGVIWAVITMGVRRAIFSNEAGLGSAPIAHAAVKTNYPIREGVVASLGPFIDTIVVCSATATVIILSGFFGTSMHQPAHTSTPRLSFESNYSLPAPYSLKNSDIPSPHDPFRDFTDGQVLEVNASQATGAVTPLSFPRFSLFNEDGGSADGIRLNLFAYSGIPTIHVLNSEGQLIDQFTLSKDAFQSELFELEGRFEQNRWSSLLLRFTPQFQQLLGSDNDAYGHLTLQVLPTSGDHWLIDNVELVNTVEGVGLTIAAFDNFFKGFGSIFITFSILFFAFSTIITWSYYGETAAGFVFGRKVIMPYRWLFVSMAFVGAITTLDTILNFADTMLGLVVIPNTIAILILSPRVVQWSKEYFAKLDAGEFKTFK